MKSTVEPVEGNKVKLSVKVDEAEIEKAINEAFRQIAREVRIPGFRPGKAPRRVLEARLGAGVARGQALNDAIPEYYAEAVREHSVDVIASPQIDITEGEEAGPVVFEATVEVRPEIMVSGYASLRATVPALEATDEEIDEQLDRLRRVHATLEVADRPAEDGDVAVIDIAGSIDEEPAPGLTAEDYSYEVGSGGIVEEVDENLRGATAGESFSFDAPHPVQEDTDLHFEITVKEIKENVLPEADDAFASDASEFETIAELRADLVARATEIRRNQAQSEMRESTGKALAELVDDDLPDALIESELRERVQDMAMRLQAQGLDLETWMRLQDKSPEQFTEELREMATISAKLDLALRSVAAQEDLAATDEDLEDEWAAIAERVEASADDVREQLERGGQVQAVRSDIEKRKAFEWLLERVEVVDEEGNPVDRGALESTLEHDTDDSAEDVDDVDGEDTE